jgi:hypothetical protein
MEAAPALAVAGGANTVTRRLVLTSTLLLERRVDSYDVVSSRPLGKVAALVRFVDDPKLMAVEWSDGSRPTMFTSVARDAVLAALLDAAQVSCPVQALAAQLPHSPWATLRANTWSLSCHGSWIMDHGSWIMDHGSWIMDHGSWIGSVRIITRV